MQKLSDSSIKPAACLTQALCIAISFALAWVISLRTPLNEKCGDLMHRCAYYLSGPRTASPHLVQAVINDKTVELLDLDSDNRNLYARVLSLLGDAGIKEIGCDVFFTEQALSMDEPMLKAAISADDHIHFPVIVASGTKAALHPTRNKKWDQFIWHPKIIKPGTPPQAGHVLYPAENLASLTAGLGHINCFVDTDGTIRRLPLLYQTEDGYWPALSLELLCRYLEVDPDSIEVSFGSHLLIPGTEKNPAIRIPIDESGMMRLSFAGPWTDSFVQFPVHRLLAAEENKDARVRLYDDLSGALLFLADSSTRRKDYGTIPLESVYPLSGIHLNALNELLTAEFPITASPGELCMIVFLTGFVLWIFIRIFDTCLAALLSAGGLLLFCSAWFFIRYFSAFVIPFPTAPCGGILLSLLTLCVYYYARSRRLIAVLRVKATSARSLELLNHELEDSNKAYTHLQRNITRILRSITGRIDVPLSRLHEVLAGCRLHTEAIPLEVLQELITATETTRSLTTLIQELEEITDIKHNIDYLSFTKIDLQPCLCGIVQRLIPLAESRGCILVCTNNEAPVIVKANKRMLEKMFFLLVVTTLKSTSPGSRVTVSCGSETSCCGIAIEIRGQMESARLSEIKPSPLESGTENNLPPPRSRSLLHGYIALHNGKITIKAHSPCHNTLRLSIPPELPVAGAEEAGENKKSHNTEKSPVLNQEAGKEAPLHAQGTSSLFPLFPRKPVFILEPNRKAANEYRENLATRGITNLRFVDKGRDLPAALQKEAGSVIMLDLALTDISGLAVLERLRETQPEIPVIVVSEIDAVEMAVESMKRGAFDFAVKPVASPRLCSLVKRAVQQGEMEAEAKKLRENKYAALKQPEAFTSIITCDPAMQDLFRIMEAFAEGSEPVFILGESGTGKELFAEALHLLSGRKGPLVKENIGALDPGVFTDTLFGHTKGAYTGAHTPRKGLVEEALNGTLFLDEIGDLNTEMQVKLLRFIESGEYRPVGSDKPFISNTRIVAATNADIDSLIKSGRFRRDLYYRLSHILRIPPLRQRTEDITLLTKYFLKMAGGKFRKAPFEISGRLHSRLQSYSFPGNVRELESLIFAAVKLSGHKTEAEAYIAQYLKSHGTTNRARRETDDLKQDYAAFPTLAEAEDRLIKEAMLRSGNNQRGAARLLGISPFALNRRLQKKEKH